MVFRLRHGWQMLLLMLLVSGCSQSPSEPLRIASSPWPGYEPIYLARDLGLLASDTFRVIELPSSNITWQAFGNGSVELATLTLDETLTLLDSGRKVRILLVLDMSHGADAVVASPAIRTLADLRGKRIAISNIPLGYYMLYRLLDAAKLTPADVEVLPLPEDMHEKWYRSGKVEAAITFEPFRSRLVAAGGHTLFDSSRIPDEIFDLLLVSEEVYRERKAEICQLGRQWFATQAHIAANPQQSYRQMGKRMGVSGEDFGRMLQGVRVPDLKQNRQLLLGESASLLAAGDRLGRIMVEQKMLSRPVDLRTALDPDYQACVQP